MWNNEKQQKIVFLMSNLETYYHFKLDFQRMDQVITDGSDNYSSVSIHIDTVLLLFFF